MVSLQTVSSRSSKSSGCDAGFGALALILAAVVVFRKRGK
ncbi:MAG: SYNERG-CTERM sorting domain-containing protein [Fretibacterium sp.]|nr:SYNERG-CTERM sorting domain-containing protein [Fretibacterium sp.]